MAGNLESIEIFPGENGGHRVVVLVRWMPPARSWFTS